MSTVLHKRFKILQKTIDKTINKLKDNSLSEFKQIYPIKPEIDLCEDKFSIKSMHSSFIGLYFINDFNLSEEEYTFGIITSLCLFMKGHPICPRQEIELLSQIFFSLIQL